MKVVASANCRLCALCVLCGSPCLSGNAPVVAVNSLASVRGRRGPECPMPLQCLAGCYPSRYCESGDFWHLVPPFAASRWGRSPHSPGNPTPALFCLRPTPLLRWRVVGICFFLDHDLNALTNHSYPILVTCFSAICE